MRERPQRLKRRYAVSGRAGTRRPLPQRFTHYRGDPIGNCWRGRAGRITRLEAAASGRRSGHGACVGKKEFNNRLVRAMSSSARSDRVSTVSGSDPRKPAMES